MVQLSRVIGSLAAFSFATALPLECQGPPPTQENDAVQSSSSSSSTGSNANAVGNQSGGKQPKALYLTTNQAPNNIISLGINVNGTLRMGNIVPTGGNGASGINGMNDMPAGPDAMFDQSPLAVSGNMIVTVNSGSNTLSMFVMDKNDHTQLKMVGQPVNTMGDFPNSVAVSGKLKQACVANTGKNSGIACFSMSETDGLKPLDAAQRPIPLGAGQTTPPVGPTNTISQILFNDDSTQLITMVKGNPPPTNATAPANGTAVNNGFVSVFPVQNGKVGTQDVRTSPPGTAVLFGSANVPGTTKVVATDASFGTTVLDIASSGQASLVAKTPLAGQVATCWAIFSKKTQSAFVTDVLLNRLTEIDPQNGNVIQEQNVNNANPGNTELATAGNYLYTLSPGLGNGTATVAAFDISGGRGTAKPIQNFQVGNGVGIAAVGLGIC